MAAGPASDATQRRGMGIDGAASDGVSLVQPARLEIAVRDLMISQQLLPQNT
jgi:hypothetical protein